MIMFPVSLTSVPDLASGLAFGTALTLIGLVIAFKIVATILEN
jgi:hypothetical protein